MANISEYLKDLEKMKSKPGFKQKDFSVSTSNGPLKMSLHGPEDFLKKMPALISTVANAPYNKAMFAALARANKPLFILFTDNRRQLGGGRIYEAQEWYCLLCVKEVSLLMIQFNMLGYHKQIPFECRKGEKTLQKSAHDELKYTLAHEFYHLWQFVDPRGAPKKGTIARSMYSPFKLQNECWATRYTNGWRYQEKRCVRYIYQHEGKNHHVDSISNHK